MSVATPTDVAVIDVDSLLAETTESPPCGPDLEYDASYLAFNQLALGKAERQFGPPAEEPIWEDVLSEGSALLKRSKDLNVAVIVVRASVHTDGFDGLLPGLRLVHGLVDRFWTDVHPHLDVDDGNDPTRRVNALRPLADPAILLRELRDVPLVRSRQHGQLLVRDIEVSLGKLAPRDKTAVLGQAQIEAALGAAAVADAAAIARVAETLAAAKALASLFDDRFGAERAPELKSLLTTLHLLTQATGKYLPVADASGAPSSTDLSSPGNAMAAPPPISGEIRTRDDALSMIDKIVQYLERSEPTNPAPLLLKRAKRFMSMSFTDIFKEISPDSAAKIDAIAGPAEKEK